MLCDARSIYVLKTMEFLDFGEIFRDAEYATTNSIDVPVIITFGNCHK